MAEQTVRYCTSADGDSNRIMPKAGERPAMLLRCGLAVLNRDDGGAVWSRWAEGVAFGHEFVYYDRRGTGSSDRKVDDISLPRARCETWPRVIDDYGEDVQHLRRIGTGRRSASRTQRRHPERVGRIVLGGAYARGADIISQEALHSTVNTARTNGRSPAEVLPRLVGHRAMRCPLYMETLRRSHSGEMAALYLEQYGTMDAAEYLDAGHNADFGDPQTQRRSRTASRQ